MAKELAIIIDCWKSPDQNSLNLLSFNIIDFISLREEIKYVVLASYDVPYNDDDNTVWRDTHRQLFFDNAPINIKYMYAIADTVRKSVGTSSVLEKTDPVLLNHVFENKLQISLRHFFELEYLLKQDEEIDTIWYFGAGWNRCVKNRELGWNYMKQLTGKELVTVSTCIGPFLHKVDTDPNWEKIDMHDLAYRHK
jgi:hypothetical protein